MPKRAMGQAGDPHPKLVVGTDFSGLDGVLMILDKLGIRYLHAFSSDNDPKVKQFQEYHHKPLVMYGDISRRVTQKYAASRLVSVRAALCCTFEGRATEANWRCARAPVGFWGVVHPRSQAYDGDLGKRH